MPSTALAFLESVLPAEGFKCATVFNDGRVFNKFFDTAAKLADFISREDALGRTVYHACAVFGTPDSRKATNALGAKAFWLDIDAGEGKVYATAVDAAERVAAFVSAHDLPVPIYVGSGNGLHIYWPLVEMADRKTWQRYATGLKRLCEQDGLVADPSRTADISSVLRTPGTHHRKAEAKVVRVGALEGPYEISRFDRFLEGEKNEQVQRSRAPVREAKSGIPSVIAAAANIYADEPRYTEALTRSCAQVAKFATTRGNLPEPEWYAALGVLAWCVDGADFSHAWSQGYAGYSHTETQARLDRSKEFGPTTCAKFESLNPKGCEGCPFKGKITSPIQLGRRQVPPGAAQASAPFESVGQNSEATAPILPKDFSWQGKRLTHKREDAKGLPSFETVSEYPIYLESVQTGEANNGFSLSFKLELPHEGTRSIILPSKTFFSSSGLSEMAGQGAIIHDNDLFKKFVRESVDMWNAENKLERRYDQFGWKDDDTAFLFGDKLYGATTVRPVIGSDEVMSRSQYLGPRRNGSVGAWSNAANSLFALGHEVQAFALLSSFAAPLMRFHSTGEGGAIVSLVSDKSGTGKTTALEAAASVWGRLKGTQIIDDDTTVAKGLKLGVFGNMACTYDELYNRDPEVIRKFVLMFTNGRDKDRGTVDGTLRHVRAEWQTILLLASNNSIVDILSSMDGTDAPAYRVLEFIMDTPASMDKRRGDKLKIDLDANSGFAADLYLRTLLQPATLKYIKDALPRWTDQVWQKTGLDKEHRFWVRTIASVIAAGTLVKHAGLLDFSVDRIANWAIEQVQQKKHIEHDARGQRGAIQNLVNFLDQHILDTLVVPKAFRPGPNQTSHVLLEPRRQLLIRNELQEGRIFINETTLNKWLVKMGINKDGFFKDLKERGVLTATSRRVTLGAGTHHSTGQSTVAEINAAHPAMSGHVQAVDNIVKAETPKRA